MNFAQKAVAQHIQNKFPTLFSGDLSGLVRDVPSHLSPEFTSLDAYFDAKEKLVMDVQRQRLDRLEDEYLDLEKKLSEKQDEIDNLRAAIGEDE